MLSKPLFGWTDITIGDWTGKLSYIDDVPIILLNAFYNVFSNQKPEVVCFDAEGINYWIVFDLSDTIIITEDENCQYSVSRQNVGVGELGMQMWDDITCKLKDWVRWAIDDNNAKDYEEREELLYNKLQQLRESIYLYETEQYSSALGVPIKADANTYRNTMDIFADLSKLFNKTENDMEYNVIKERDNENYQTRQA